MVSKFSRVGLVVMAAISASTVALACGDKLMLLVGGAHFRQVYRSAHPASILAYDRPDSVVPGIVRNVELQRALKQGGYKFDSVEDLTGLEEALKTGKYDLLLVDVTDAESLRQQLRAATSKPTLLPVMFNSTKAEAKAAEKEYHSVLKAPASAGRYLAEIDDAIERRDKAGSTGTSR
jgi:hypothetical protein